MFGIIRFIVNFVLGIIEFLLLVRFALVFFGANAGTPFAAWIYGTSGPLLLPFWNILPTFHVGVFIIDLTTLAALVVYAIIGNLILGFFSRKYAG